MIISLHTPKAGGSSFKELLQSHYKSNFRGDYNDIPINKSLKQRTADAELFHMKFKYIMKYIYKFKKIQCIHGHFLIYKYSSLINDPETLFITWLRDPIERLASHYYYWNRAYNVLTSAPLHKKVVEEKWSLEKFCFSKEMQNIYCKLLWHFPKERFDFIGITEFFDEDMAYFAQEYFGIENIHIPSINVNIDKREPYFSDLDLIKRIKDFHSKDYEIYKYAQKRRVNRTRKSLSNTVNQQ